MSLLTISTCPTSTPPCASTPRHSALRWVAVSTRTSVELLGWPAPVYLLAKAPGTIGAGGDQRRYTRDWTPVHPDVVVEDVDDAAAARAVGAGAKLEAPAKDTAYGKIAMLADPFGHRFCLQQINERGYDALNP